MLRARRSAYVFFRLSDELVPDVARLLAGEVELVPYTRLLALSALTGEEHGVSDDELHLIATLPGAGWAELCDLAANGRTVDVDVLRRLALAGVVVTDGDEAELARIRVLDERLAGIGWSPHAALYHAFSRWRDVDVGDVPAAPPEDGPVVSPPGAFHALPGPHEIVDLPLVQREDGLFGLLRQRKTTRGLDATASLTLDELGLLLSHTFGCQGFRDLGGGVVVLKKTSPSGGSLHPIEAYPLVVGVEGLAPGLYHYRADRHALELVTSLPVADARELLVECAAGQTYLSGASVLVIMTARFERSFWKYRHPRGYAVLHMDAAHLSQTFYLLCAELGLGAFVSAAVNAGNIEDRLGIDGIEEGVVALCGCGRPTDSHSPFDVEFEPYVPRETTIE